jgi:opacity protein-like surface antigen
MKRRTIAALFPLVLLGVAAPASADYPAWNPAFEITWNSAYDSCEARSSWCRSTTVGTNYTYGSHSRYFDYYLNNSNGQRRCVVRLWIGHSYEIWDKQVRDYNNWNNACTG